MTTNLDAIKTIKRALKTGKIVHLQGYVHGVVTLGPYHTATGENMCAAFWSGIDAQKASRRWGLSMERIGSPDAVAAFVLEVCGRRVNGQIKKAFGW